MSVYPLFFLASSALCLYKFNLSLRIPYACQTTYTLRILLIITAVDNRPKRISGSLFAVRVHGFANYYYQCAKLAVGFHQLQNETFAALLGYG